MNTEFEPAETEITELTKNDETLPISISIIPDDAVTTTDDAPTFTEIDWQLATDAPELPSIYMAPTVSNPVVGLSEQAEVYPQVGAYPPLPEPPVNTAPRPVTIVWGFIIMALGVLAMTFASGANVDYNLALIWLPAICGLALILAAILTALRKTRSTIDQ